MSLRKCGTGSGIQFNGNLLWTSWRATHSISIGCYRLWIIGM